jgi:hypothetical protein
VRTIKKILRWPNQLAKEEAQKNTRKLEIERWTTVIPVNEGWWCGHLRRSLALVGWLMKPINHSCTEQCSLCIE